MFGASTLTLLPSPVAAHEDEDLPAPSAHCATSEAPALVQSQGGQNAWNRGRPSDDWWHEIERQHGHVGPWNVLGWRVGQVALREFQTEWGRHELDIICYLPPQTPFTCLLDGVSVGTGNSLGRLDLRWAEVFDYRQAFVAVRRKNSEGPILEVHLRPEYLRSIVNQPVEALEGLSRDCLERAEKDLFELRRLPVPSPSS